MRLMSEDQILDERLRKKLIEEFKAGENIRRKTEYKRRYDVYKDKTKDHVINALIAEGLKPETVAQMSNRAGNISIARKIVNKKARAYSGGVTRTSQVEAVTQQVDDLAKLLAFDQRMKKGDRYRELHKNCLLQVVPEIDLYESEGEQRKYKLKFSVLPPWQYDVVEDWYDREKPMVVVISDFTEQNGPALGNGSDRKDNMIADTPSDAGMGERKEYVWWSSRYHFTTDAEGKVIPERSPEGMANPIGMLPFANNAEEQDGQFWAVGGDDLIDGTILVNKLITDMNFIAYLQGYGQIVVTGKNVGSEKFRFGPNNAVVIEWDPESGEPQPNVDIISANPPLDAWMRIIEQYLALLLTTNNLSASNVASNLTAANFPSGIAMLIEQAESTDNVVDKQKAYVEIERTLWEVTRRWHSVFFEAGALCADFAAVGKLPEELDVAVKFNEAKPAVTEAEKLENIKRRKDLGINEQVDLIMLDNPDMTREDAEKKLLAIKAEKVKAVDQAMVGAIKTAENTPAEDPDGDQAEDQNQDQTAS